MEISAFFEPLDISEFPDTGEASGVMRLGNIIQIHTAEGGFPDYSGCHIALIGVTDDRGNTGNEGCGMAPNPIRKHLYSLNVGPYPVKMVDLGNIRTGFAVTDTYFALSAAVAEMIENNIVPVILGGSQDLTFAHYQAYQSLGQIINIVAVDPMFDLGKSDEEINARSYLSHIILHQPNYLFNYANIGYQTYFIDQDALRLMKNLFFDTYRLGIVRESIEDVEPIVRNADMLTFDISAIRASDAPGNANATPNGFYGEEACQILRYAGLSDKMTSVGFYEVNPSFDRNGQTAMLVAQMIWYFIDGYYNRAHDFPFRNEEDYLKYRVSIRDHKEEIVFFKSKKTDRWWMEIPLPAEQRIRYQRHYLVPCTYGDYQTACENDIPDRWWMAYQKLM
ncbi:MAG TPA: formimidoylglutamase [Bacteroidales bacterium]|nr:formimidoylglutamase [Bacteroidales bacterium]HPS62669.1 formimidoylglutamase [Bacteroidales bacterium]